jgi:hypothetical protein
VPVGLEVLAICAFGVAFLLADARIFGADTQRYTDIAQFLPLREQLKEGFLPIRPLLLRLQFFRELLSCYFCMGVWTGMGVHTLLLSLFGPRYVLWHGPSWQAWLQGLVVAATFSAPLVYVINRVVMLLESHES